MLTVGIAKEYREGGLREGVTVVEAVKEPSKIRVVISEDGGAEGVVDPRSVGLLGKRGVKFQRLGDVAVGGGEGEGGGEGGS